MYYPNMNKSICEYIRFQNITHQDFAKLLELSDVTLRNKRFGRVPFTIDEIVSISKILNYPIDFLLSSPLPFYTKNHRFDLCRGRKTKVQKNQVSYAW